MSDHSDWFYFALENRKINPPLPGKNYSVLKFFAGFVNAAFAE